MVAAPADDHATIPQQALANLSLIRTRMLTVEEKRIITEPTEMYRGVKKFV
jgi:hypothetical protein